MCFNLDDSGDSLVMTLTILEEKRIVLCCFTAQIPYCIAYALIHSFLFLYLLSSVVHCRNYLFRLDLGNMSLIQVWAHFFFNLCSSGLFHSITFSLVPLPLSLSLTVSLSVCVSLSLTHRYVSPLTVL